jgi:TRAP transporter TAXI family solute receptor
MIDLTSSGDFAIYEFTDAELDAIIKKILHILKPSSRAEPIPVYDKDIKTWAVANSMHCRTDLGEEYVYLFTKAIYENLDTLVNAHKVLKNVQPENALNGLTAPLHPGAEKYYKEVGIIK